MTWVKVPHLVLMLECLTIVVIPNVLQGKGGRDSEVPPTGLVWCRVVGAHVGPTIGHVIIFQPDVVRVRVWSLAAWTVVQVAFCAQSNKSLDPELVSRTDEKLGTCTCIRCSVFHVIFSD